MTPVTASAQGTLGIVAIGRNEGGRLAACLDAATSMCARVVYVDSGSLDGSVALARSKGVHVVELDPARPFTAARARNEGADALLAAWPDAELIQFVDGDSELMPGWLDAGAAFLDAHPDTAIVCGRVRERDPNASVYARLCDMEWDLPVGETDACGGIMMVRAAAFREAGGFNPGLIAGEEPEMCHRLRRSGWKVHRLAAEMTLHDAAMTRFDQWWRRAVRTGAGYALGHAMHGRFFSGYYGKELRSIVFWAAALPAAVVVATLWAGPAALLLLLAYAALWRRIRAYRTGFGDPTRDAALYASFCVLGKFAELTGAVRFWLGRLFRRPPALIEYK